jgi:hypothetical protein
LVVVGVVGVAGEAEIEAVVVVAETAVDAEPVVDAEVVVAVDKRQQ